MSSWLLKKNLTSCYVVLGWDCRCALPGLDGGLRQDRMPKSAHDLQVDRTNGSWNSSGRGSAPSAEKTTAFLSQEFSEFRGTVNFSRKIMDLLDLPMIHGIWKWENLGIYHGKTTLNGTCSIANSQFTLAGKCWRFQRSRSHELKTIDWGWEQ